MKPTRPQLYSKSEYLKQLRRDMNASSNFEGMHSKDDSQNSKDDSSDGLRDRDAINVGSLVASKGEFAGEQQPSCRSFDVFLMFMFLR